MKKLIYAVLGIIVLLVIAAVSLPFFVSTDSIANQIVAAVKERTGRDLTIGSDPKLALFPSIAIEARDVALSNPGGPESGALVSMGEIKVDLALMPLIRGDIDVKRFILVEPVIALSVDANGRANWDFDDGAAEAPSGEAAESATDSGGAASGGAGSGLGQIRLGQIEVVDGVLSYDDARTGTSQKFTGINIALSLPDLASPLKAAGAADWNGETVNLEIDLGSPQAVMDGKATSLSAAITSPHVSTSFKGSLSAVDGKIVVTGDVDTKTPSLRELARWAGNPLTPGNGLQAFSMTSKVNYADSTITASDAKIALDGMNAQGSAVVNLAGARPAVRASLGVDKIDINSYLSGGGGGASGTSDGSGSGSGSSGGGAAGGGWSNDKFDFTGLSAVDADLKLAANAILYKNIKIGKSALDVALKNGKLNAKLTQLALYGGNGSGALTLDGAAATPAMGASFAVSGIDARPLLTDLMGMKWLEGKGQLTIAVSAQGASQRQMVSSLGGNAKLVFTDGAINGINIPQMIRSLGSNPLSGWSGGGTQKTDFSSFSASFAIAKGIATNSDMQLVSPLVRVTGAGIVNLPAQSLDYKVRPKLVASLEGQGGAVDLSGLDIPVVIKGPWSNPQIYPDIKGILENPEAAYKALKSMGGNIDDVLKKGGTKELLKGKPEDVLNRVLGKEDDGSPIDGDGEKKDPIGKVLKKLF